MVKITNAISNELNIDMDNELTNDDIRKYLNDELHMLKMFAKHEVKFDDEYFLCLCDLFRFIKENHRAPKKSELSPKFGYLPHSMFRRHFKIKNGVDTLNKIMYKNGKVISGTKLCRGCATFIDEDAPETCQSCLNRKERKKIRTINNTDIKSDTNIQSEIKKIIGDFTFSWLENTKVHCIESNKYGTLIFKTSKLSKNNRWLFDFKDFEEFCNKNLNCLCLGFDKKNNDILFAWIVPVFKNSLFRKSFGVYDTTKSFANNKKFLIC